MIIGLEKCVHNGFRDIRYTLVYSNYGIATRKTIQPTGVISPAKNQKLAEAANQVFIFPQRDGSFLRKTEISRFILLI